MHTNPETILSTAPSEKKLSLMTKFATRLGVEAEKMKNTLKATAFKVKDGVSDEQMMALLIVADQYNLNPFTKEIYAFPDKFGGIVPVVGVDGWNRIALEHPQYDGLEFIYSQDEIKINGSKTCWEWVECKIWRKDKKYPFVAREYLTEVYRSSEKPGPWQINTRRMLTHKADIQAKRRAFGFAGIYDEDEAERILDMGHAKVVTNNPRGSSLNKALEQQVNETVVPPKVNEHITVNRDEEAEEHFKRTMAAESEEQA